MEDELRLSLLVVGTIIIVAVLAHGIWKIRKNNGHSTRRNRVEPGQWDEARHSDDGDYQDKGWHINSADSNLDSPTGQHDFDELGVGKVRVVGGATASSEQHNESAGGSSSPSSNAGSESGNTASEQTKPAAASDVSGAASQGKSDAEKQQLYGSVVTNPKPHMQKPAGAHTEHDNESDHLPEPPGFLLKEKHGAGASTAAGEVDDFSLDAPGPGQTEADEDSNSQTLRKTRGYRQRQEPNFGDDQMRIDFDDTPAAPGAQRREPEQATPSAATKPVQQEVLVLNVRATEDNPISGAALLPMLLTLGFKFGDQDIFHRHVNSNGKGPVLFSLANMFKPGVFDIDNLETFTTVGVSLFMILPIEGEAHQVFNMMHNAARKIAEEFGAQVLDGRRSVLTKQGLQQYFEKIRDFERRRMLSRA